jgi:hypothetical protein
VVRSPDRSRWQVRQVAPASTALARYVVDKGGILQAPRLPGLLQWAWCVLLVNALDSGSSPWRRTHPYSL